MFDTRFRNPCSFLLGGVSQSGKTTFTLNLLRNIDSLFVDPRCAQNVIYCYKKDQPKYKSFKEEKIVHKWINALPTKEEIDLWLTPFTYKGGSVIIIDDFAEELNKDTVELLSVQCHHTNTVAILLVQNLFSKNPVCRDVSLNSTYIALFKNPRDGSQITNLAKQFAPGRTKYITAAFAEATLRPFSYLLFDFHQETPSNIRVRSRVLPNEGPMVVWISK